MPPDSIHLNELSQGMPGLSPAKGSSLAEAAAVCLENQSHTPGAQLSVSGSLSRVFGLGWDAVNAQQLKTYNDLQEATEEGACGIAVLTVKNFDGNVVLERSKKGTGFDYWMGEKDDCTLFQNKARLEVSGILNGTESILEARVQQKIEQATKIKSTLPAYVAVVEFGNPRARLVKRWNK